MKHTALAAVGELIGLASFDALMALVLWATYNNLPFRDAFGHLAFWPALGCVLIVNWLTRGVRFGGADE